MLPLQWWAESAPPGRNTVKVSQNLGWPWLDQLLRHPWEEQKWNSPLENFHMVSTWGREKGGCKKRRRQGQGQGALSVIEIKRYRDWSPKFETWLNIMIDIVQKARTTDTQWRHKSKISEKLGRCGRQNMLPPYLKIWEWEWIFGCAVKAISSLGVRSPWLTKFISLPRNCLKCKAVKPSWILWPLGNEASYLISCALYNVYIRAVSS